MPKQQQGKHLPGRRDAIHSAKAAVDAYSKMIGERVDMTEAEKKAAVQKYAAKMARGEQTE